MYGMVLYIFFLFIEVINSSNKIYKIPFAQHNYEYIFNTQKNISNIVETIFFNVIYVNLSFGTPAQKIPFQLNINSESFYILDKSFTPKDSNSFNFISSKVCSLMKYLSLKLLSKL